jgi:uracil-DNA glycosylase family 4
MTNIVPKSLHALYLQAMDIPVWVRRDIPLIEESVPVNVTAQTPPEPDPIVSEKAAPPVNMSEPAVQSPVTTNVPSAEVLQAPPDAIQTDQPLTVAPPVITSTPAEVVQVPPNATQTDQPPTTALPSDSAVHELDWESLQQRVANCTACELCKTRNQTVFGVGNRQADLMLIGEAPGADEDAIGEPFVGQAGKLLNDMLYAIDFKRESVYIANIIKCRPPDNRNPLPDEMNACNAFLQRQIHLIQPKLIVAVGGVAAHQLLSTDTAISKLRGQRFEYGETKIPLIATYHPAYLLRRPTEKRRSWQDLQFIRQTLNFFK